MSVPSTAASLLEGTAAAILESITDGICALDCEYRFVVLNDGFERHIGIPREQVLGKPYWEVFPIAKGTHIQEILEATARTGRSQQLETVSLISGAPILLRTFPSPEGITVVFTDVSDRHEAERERRRAEAERDSQIQTFDAVLASLHEFVYMLDLQGRFRYVNKPLLDLWGMTLEEAQGKNFRDLGYPEHLVELHDAQIRRAIESKEPVHGSNAYTSSSGAVGYYEYTFVPLFGPDGSVQSVGGHTRDVTERIQRDHDLADIAADSERQRRLYEAVLSNTPDLQYVFGLDHRFLYANEALLRMWGRTWDDAIGKNCLELGYEPWHAEMHDREIEQVVATKAPIRGVVPFSGTNGRRIYDYIFVPVLGENGEVEAVAGATRDVTDSVLAEEALRDSEARWRAIFENAAVGIALVSLDGKWTQFNGALAAILDYPAEELRGLTFADVTHPDDIEEDWAQARRLLAGQIASYSMEKRYLRKDGRIAWANLTVSLIRSEKGEPVQFVSVVEDITQRKEAEEELQSSLRLQRLTFDAVPACLSYFDAEERFVATNAVAAQWFGRSASDLIGTPLRDAVGEEAYQHHAPLLDRVRKGLPASLETTVTLFGGRKVIANIHYVPNIADGLEGFVVMLQDVTEERGREQSLRFLVELESATRGEDDPERIMYVAAKMLAEHLGADRCAYAEVDAREEQYTILGDYARHGLPSRSGTYPIAAFGESILFGHRRGKTYVLEDRESEISAPDELSSFRAAGVAATVSVPIVKKGKLVGIMGTSSRAPRRWTSQEVELVEMVANRCWTYIEQVRTVRIVRESERQYRQIAEGLPQMVWSARPDGVRDYFNHRWIEYTGVGLGESENPWVEVLHPDDAHRAVPEWWSSVATGEPFQAQYRLRSKGGKYRWYLGRAIPLRNEDGEIMRWFGTCTDIHDQRRTQEALEITNEFSKSLVADLNLDRIVQALCDASTQAIGAQFGSFFYTVEGDEGEALLLYTLSGAPIEAFEKFGLPRPTKIFGPTFRNEGIVRSDDITKDPRYGSMGPHYGMPKGHLPVVSYLAVPVVSRSGEVIGGLFFGHPQPGVFTEEHERIVSSFAAQASVAMDNARLYDQVRSMNQELERKVDERTGELLSAVERLQGFTYHVSHDLRAPLRAISSTSHVVREDYGDLLPQEGHELLARQAEAATRLGQLVDDLLKVSRLSRQEMLLQEVDVTHLARDAAAEALSTHPYSTVEVSVDPGLVAKADPRLLRLALLNLVENAVKYSPSGGKVRVGRREDGAYFVSDEGIGIDARYFHKIFEPFQRLHLDSEFAGTGIGLANVAQVVERHGGKVWVESEPGKGSTFLFTLGGA